MPGKHEMPFLTIDSLLFSITCRDKSTSDNTVLLISTLKKITISVTRVPFLKKSKSLVSPNNMPLEQYGPFANTHFKSLYCKSKSLDRGNKFLQSLRMTTRKF